jgi:hypothetical protein
MATKTFYILPDASAGTSAHGSLQDGGSAPISADANSQWNSGVTPSGNYAKYNRDAIVPASAFNTVVQPDGNIDNVHGDCLRTQNAYKGAFASGNWTFTFGLRSNLSRIGATAALRFRLFRSSDPGGANATEITTSTQQTSNAAGDTTVYTISVTFNPGAFSLTNEYLFVELAITIGGTTPTSNTWTWILQTGSTFNIATTDFAADVTPLFDQKTHAKKKKQWRKKRGPKKRSRWIPPNGVVMAQPFPFKPAKRKQTRKKWLKKKQRKQADWIAYAPATSPPLIPFPWPKKKRRPKPRPRIKKHRPPHLLSYFKQLTPALCGHAVVLEAESGLAKVTGSLAATSKTLEALAATGKVIEDLAATGKSFEALTAIATTICCK